MLLAITEMQCRMNLMAPAWLGVYKHVKKKNASASIWGVLTFFIYIYLHSSEHYSIVKQSCVGGEEASRL